MVFVAFSVSIRRESGPGWVQYGVGSGTCWSRGTEDGSDVSRSQVRWYTAAEGRATVLRQGP